MRTTIEIKPEHRSALMTVASNRGEKGFSSVLEDAIDRYLEGEAERNAHRNDFIALAGALSEESANELESEVEDIRAHWR